MSLDPSGSAASRTVDMFTDRTPAFPALAEPTAEQPRDLPAEVRKLLLASKPLTRDDIQAELGEPRVALGQIAAALDAIGATVDGDERWSLRSIEDAEKIAARRADVLRAMFARINDDESPTAQDLADDIEGGDLVDVITEAADALVEAGALFKSQDVYDLADGIGAKIIRHGALFIARATLPELTQPIEDRTAFELAATERFEAERKAKLEAQGERDRLCAWLREKGQDPSEILHPAEPVAPGPKRDVFLWTKIVPVDDAVDLEIAREERKLRAELALSQAALDTESGRHKGVKDRVNGRLAELSQAIIDKSFHRAVEAYKVPLWDEGVTLVIKASDGTTILDREPIAKGAQRMIPGTEAAPAPKAESVAPAKDAAEEATADAAQTQEERAATLRDATTAKWLAAAEDLLRGFGSAGLEWGKDGDDAVNALARRMHGKERGRLPAGFAESARKALDTLLTDGRAVMGPGAECVIWAEHLGNAAE